MPFHVFDKRDLPYEVLLCGRAPGPVETDMVFGSYRGLGRLRSARGA